MLAVEMRCCGRGRGAGVKGPCATVTCITTVWCDTALMFNSEKPLIGDKHIAGKVHVCMHLCGKRTLKTGMFKAGVCFSLAFSESWLPWTPANVFQIVGKQHRVVESTFNRKVTSKVNHCQRQKLVTRCSSETGVAFFSSSSSCYTKASLCILLQLHFTPVKEQSLYPPIRKMPVK